VSKSTCLEAGCTTTAHAREYCNIHYQRKLKNGSLKPLKTLNSRPPEERFWDFVTKTSTCWLWHGRTDRDGYGAFCANYRDYRAHRYSYMQLIGDIPEGLVIDHLCRVRNCVNPEHMEPVTGTENTMRGEGAGAQNSQKTHCKYGHEYTEENTYRYNNGKWRNCKTCKRS
jgi:hypothetical protein